MQIKEKIDLREILKGFGRKEIVKGTVASVGSQKGATDYIVIDLMTGMIMDFKDQSENIGLWVSGGLTDVNVQEPKEVLNIVRLANGTGYAGTCPTCSGDVLYAGDRRDCRCRTCSQFVKWKGILII